MVNNFLKLPPPEEPVVHLLLWTEVIKIFAFVFPPFYQIHLEHSLF